MTNPDTKASAMLPAPIKAIFLVSNIIGAVYPVQMFHSTQQGQRFDILIFVRLKSSLSGQKLLPPFQMRDFLEISAFPNELLLGAPGLVPHRPS